MCAMKVLLISLLAVATVVAQEKPADAPHDMEHMDSFGLADTPGFEVFCRGNFGWIARQRSLRMTVRQDHRHKSISNSLRGIRAGGQS